MPRLNDVIATLRRRSHREEGGFTVTELAAAFAILLLALTALARTATVAFSDVSNARQRQTGSQFANQLLEEVRGLAFDTVKKGLATSDLTTDTNIKSCGSGVYRYLSCTTGEVIVHTAYPAGTTISPLVPHTGTLAGSPGTYSYRTYVTEAAGAPTAGIYRVTVIVDWASPSRAGARSDIEVQTLVYSPQGCVDTATHPFGAPCQPYYYATGTAGGGNVSITGNFEGADYDSMSGTLVSSTADAQIEQVALVQGNVSLSDISKVEDGVQTTVSDGTFSSADSDPSTPSSAYSSGSAGPQAPGALQVRDGPDTLDMALASGSQASSISTTTAGGANACNLQNDAKPCGFGSATQSGGLSLTADLQDGGATTLLTVGTSSTPVRAYVRRYQPVATENGLVREQLVWNLPEIRIAGLPQEIGTPTGWQGYWVRLSGFSATATVEAGTSTAAPTVTISGGTITYWHGAGYNTTNVTAAGGEVPINSFTRTVSTRGKQLRVDIAGTVTTEPSTASSTVTTGTTRSQADARIGAPLVAEFNYLVSEEGDPTVDLDFVVTAGQGVATATYRPTPSG